MNTLIEESIDLYNTCDELLNILSPASDDFYYVSDIESRLENYISLYKDGHSSDKPDAIRELQYVLKFKPDILKIKG